MANAACDRLSELAWEAQEFGQYSMHKAFYRTIRDEFPLSAQVVVRLNSKVADAYKIDQKVSAGISQARLDLLRSAYLVLEDGPKLRQHLDA